MRRFFVLSVAGGMLGALSLEAQQVPPSQNVRIHDIVAAVSAERIGRDIERLVGFGTRHTASDTLSPTRGIGAARRWIFA